MGGRGYVRRVLYMATLVATRHNELIGQFYRRLKRGKPRPLRRKCRRFASPTTGRGFFSETPGKTFVPWRRFNYLGRYGELVDKAIDAVAEFLEYWRDKEPSMTPTAPKP